jgi:hypothetical protein
MRSLREKDEGGGIKDDKAGAANLAHPSAFILHPFIYYAAVWAIDHGHFTNGASQFAEIRPRPRLPLGQET